MQWNTVKRHLEGAAKMSDYLCCRINHGKIHYEDTKGTENKISDHLFCRINHGLNNCVLLYSRSVQPVMWQKHFKTVFQGEN